MGDQLINRYLGEIAKGEVLGAERERAACEEIRQLETTLWRELFSYPPAVGPLLDQLELWVVQQEPERRPDAAVFFAMRASPRSKCGSAAEDGLITTLLDYDEDREWLLGAAKLAQRLDDASAGECLDPIRRTAEFVAYTARIRSVERSVQQARDRFLRNNLRLVVAVAKRYTRGTMPLLDLIQEGNIGLMRAIAKFDHTKGFRFSTYASWWIRHAVTRSMADKSRAVRLPTGLVSAANKVARAEREFVGLNARRPDDSEIAAATGLSFERVARAREVTLSDALSLDNPTGQDDSGSTFLDLLSDESALRADDALELREMHTTVRDLFDCLTPQERSIIRWRFGIDGENELSLREIGEKFLLSRERIRQLQERGMGKLRKHLRKGVEL